MTFVPRRDIAEVQICAGRQALHKSWWRTLLTKMSILRPPKPVPCYKCLACSNWFCENCDLVHACSGCGGTYCLSCRPCPYCQTWRVQGIEPTPHPMSVSCRCGHFKDLASGACSGCRSLACLAPPKFCSTEILTNSCCGQDKCWDCSWWYRPPRNNRIRICRTCPIPSTADLEFEVSDTDA